MKVEIMQKEGTAIVNLNRRRAIRERCLNCSCWNRAEVSKCSFTDCQLYPYRMGRGKQDPKEREKAIRDYCLWCCAGQASEVYKCVSRLCPLYPYRKSGVDRSVEVSVLIKKQHIDGDSEAKKTGLYTGIG